MPPPSLPPHLSYKSSLILLPLSSITQPIETLRRKHDKQFHRWPPHINVIYPFLASPTNSGTTKDETASPAVRGETVGSKAIDEQDCPNASESTPDSQGQLRADIRARISRAVKDIHPFRITLCAENDSYFIHGKRSATVWLNPRVGDPKLISSPSSGDVLAHNPDSKRSGSQDLKNLQASLQTEFAECNADTRPFTPHLSIGQAGGKEDAGQLVKEARDVLDEFLHHETGDPKLHPGTESAPTQISDANRDTEQDGHKGLEWLVDRVFVIERRHFDDRFRIVGSVKLGDT